jgi:hypothetical protein
MCELFIVHDAFTVDEAISDLNMTAPLPLPPQQETLRTPLTFPCMSAASSATFNPGHTVRAFLRRRFANMHNTVTRGILDVYEEEENQLEQRAARTEGSPTSRRSSC